MIPAMDYSGKTVIITGGTQGIGEGCARVFVGAGASVVLASPDAARGPGVARSLTEQGPGRAHFQRCDVTSDADRQALIAGTVERDGRLDCLVNNAGWHPPHKPIDDFSLDDFRRLLELNVVSVFALSKLALPHLRRTRGSIVNVASLVATIGQHHATTYVATKGAVKSFTKALAVDEAVHGVRVNSISPGNVFTPLWQEAIDAAPDGAAARADGEAAQWFGRMGTPEEVGRLCLFLASEATFTTGVDHIISGGAEIGYGRKPLAR
jgi:NAD(P)-dependent dehydrogenase (short-subunit alcohol dehydrogenase family)